MTRQPHLASSRRASGRVLQPVAGRRNARASARRCSRPPRRDSNGPRARPPGAPARRMMRHESGTRWVGSSPGTSLPPRSHLGMAKHFRWEVGEGRLVYERGHERIDAGARHGDHYRNRVFVYWDNSNIPHEAQRLAEEREGTPGTKYLIRIHFEDLWSLAETDRLLAKAVTVGFAPLEIQQLFRPRRLLATNWTWSSRGAGRPAPLLDQVQARTPCQTRRRAR